MEGHRLDIHHSLSARRAGATGLLHDHRDGVGFIEKAKTPVRISLPPISGINVNTTSNKDPEGVRDKRADPVCP